MSRAPTRPRRQPMPLHASTVDDNEAERIADALTFAGWILAAFVAGVGTALWMGWVS